MVIGEKNKVAVVTGGASGIGKATVLKFAEQNIDIAIIDRNKKEADCVIHKVNEAGGKAVYFDCDITDEVSVKQTMYCINQSFGRIDYAFNNAGIGGEFAKLENYPSDDWDKVISINLKAVFLCMKYEIPFMLKQKGSCIVNTASVLSTVAYENDSAYVASKFGVLGLTKNAALEYASSGLRINAVSPGFTRTPMIDKGDENKLQQLAYKHPIGRLAQAEEIANAVVWLCSEDASFMIGHNLIIDGGYTLV